MYIVFILLIIFLVPWIFLGSKIGLTLGLIIIVCTISRESPLMDYMNIEIHSLLILGVGHVLGVFWGMFTAIFTYPLMFWLDLHLEFLPDPGANPFNNIIDTAILLGLAIIGAVVGRQELLLFGIIYIILGNNILSPLLKLFIEPEPIFKRIAIGILNVFVNYILISRYTPLIISLLT